MRGTAWLGWAAALAAAGCGSGCAVLRATGPVNLPEAPYSSAEHNDFGVVYETEGDLRRARTQYESAVRRDPANAVAWTNLGNVLSRNGRHEPARDAYRRALAVAPGYGPAVNNLALSYLDGPDPDPELARSILEAHLPFCAPEFQDALHDTLHKIRDSAAREQLP